MSILRHHGPVNVIIYFPKTEEGQEKLSHRVAEVHANAVSQQIQKLTCTTNEKLQLLDAVIETAKLTRNGVSETVQKIVETHFRKNDP